MRPGGKTVNFFNAHIDLNPQIWIGTRSEEIFFFVNNNIVILFFTLQTNEVNTE